MGRLDRATHGGGRRAQRAGDILPRGAGTDLDDIADAISPHTAEGADLYVSLAFTEYEGEE